MFDPPRRRADSGRYPVEMSPNSKAPDRANSHMAELVDAAVELQLELGPRAAASFLTANGASFQLTVRVLSEPGRRRRAT